ncbi:MAG: 3-dehydroquinate dehydratase [Bacteroidales bacterium]|nr:3-dehydroquinate dehydratase [Bacteroidales bacterium]
MKIIIINGPNLEFIGKREPEIYGNKNIKEYFYELKNIYKSKNIDLEWFFSNKEGEIIKKLQEVDTQCDGIILNAGGYSHTSVAISDTIRMISTPVIEVHISNIFSREEYRHISLTAINAIGVIIGFGLKSYKLAIESFLISNGK